MPLDGRTKGQLELILEEACRTLPNGGDHAFRKKIAQELLNSARKGNTSPDGLAAVARRTIEKNSSRKTA
jgi:hypothetical protein